jgi:hypothetical protein
VGEHFQSYVAFAAAGGFASQRRAEVPLDYRVDRLRSCSAWDESLLKAEPKDRKLEPV